ncbi:MAG: small ribosomal subunit Rsm22 family protein, partial [Neglectibacter sp.]
MELPMTLQAALAEQLDSAQQAEVLSAAGEVSRRYRAREKKSFQIRNRAEALAYALARMPATYGAVCRALRYSLEGLGGLTQAPLSLLDVGAGTGAAAWAAAGLAELSSVTCLEYADEMRKLG